MSTDVISSGLNSGDCNLDEMCCWRSRIRVSLRVPLFSRVFPFSDLTHRSFLLSLLILFHTSLPSSLFFVFSPRLYSAFAQVYYDKLSFISPTLSLFLYCRSHLFLFATLSSQRLSLFLFSFPPHCLSFFKTMLFLSRSIFSSYFSTAFPFSLLSSPLFSLWDGHYLRVRPPNLASDLQPPRRINTSWIQTCLLQYLSGCFVLPLLLCFRGLWLVGGLWCRSLGLFLVCFLVF